MITATLRIEVGPERNADVNRLLRSLIGPTSVEVGCISCRLYHEVDHPNIVTWVEEWRSDKDLKQHLRSARYRKILAALEMSNAEPEIRFDTVVETSDLKLIAEARGVTISD